MEKEELKQYYIDKAPKMFNNGSLSVVEDEGISRFVELTLIIKEQQVEILVLQGKTLEEANALVYPELEDKE